MDTKTMNQISMDANVKRATLKAMMKFTRAAVENLRSVAKTARDAGYVKLAEKLEGDGPLPDVNEVGTDVFFAEAEEVLSEEMDRERAEQIAAKER